jgi:hypothetical protein
MSMLSAFTDLMTPDTIGQLSKVVGVDRSQTQKGLEVIGPLVLGSLARKSATAGGVESIMGLVPRETGQGLMAQLLSATGQRTRAEAPGLLSSVLGPGVSTIGKALDGRLGFDATGLMSMAAPAILGVIGSAAKEKKLSATDIAATLQTESSAALAAAKPEVRAVLDEAFQLGDRAQALKASFTENEWKKIRLAPAAATLYVASASPSGARGLSKEIIAAGETLKTLVKDALPTSLVDVAFGSFEGPLLDKEGGLDERSPRHDILAVLTAAMQTIKAKRPVDAQAFRDTIVTLSRKVAEASKEGAFLGIGGTLVSPEEEQALGDIAAAVA